MNKLVENPNNTSLVAIIEAAADFNVTETKLEEILFYQYSVCVKRLSFDLPVSMVSHYKLFPS